MRSKLLGIVAVLLSTVVGEALYAAPAVAAPAAPMVEKFVAGTHYQVLSAPVPTQDPKRIEVVEMFSYGCPHCFEFEPAVSAWRAHVPADVDFELLPAVFNSQFRSLGQAYYTAKVLKIAEKAHEATFKALHVEQRPLFLISEMTKFYAGYGIKEADFMRTYDSFGVNRLVKRADDLQRLYQVNGVPSMIVNGKYMVDGRMAGSNSAMLEVVDFLVAKERAARHGVTAGPSVKPLGPPKSTPATKPSTKPAKPASTDKAKTTPAATATPAAGAH